MGHNLLGSNPGCLDLRLTRAFGFAIMHKTVSPAQLVAISFLISLLGAECALRGFGNLRTMSEVAGLGYGSRYDIEWDSYYRMHPPLTTYHNLTGDFDYIHRTNKLGFVGPVTEERKSGFRIAVLGDSFTEGVGAMSPDSSYPALLDGLLQSRYPHLRPEVFNFGIGGSDVVFETRYLLDSISQFLPDLVIMTYNCSDITDIALLGGEERF